MATAHPKRGRERDIDPATPFHEFPGPLLVSTARRFAELGVDEALAAAIRQPQSEAVVRRHLAAIRDELLAQPTRREIVRSVPSATAQRFRPHLIRGLYAAPMQQLANVRTWNRERHWNIPEDWFTNLGPAPTWPDGKFKCVTLEVALPDQLDELVGKVAGGAEYRIHALPGMIRTVRELWGIISHQHPNASKWDQFHLDAEHLELLDGATYEPGLRWRVHDLGANWDTQNGIRPIDVRNPQTSPNVDGFATLAHHPKYVRSMNGTTTPFLWIAGFMVAVPGLAARRGVPIASFGRGGRQVVLHVRWYDHRNPNYSVPVRLGA